MPTVRTTDIDDAAVSVKGCREARQSCRRWWHGVLIVLISIALTAGGWLGHSVAAQGDRVADHESRISRLEATLSATREQLNRMESKLDRLGDRLTGDRRQE